MSNEGTGWGWADSKRRWVQAAMLALGASIFAPVATAFAAFATPPQAVVIRGAASGCEATIAAEVSSLGGRMTRQLAILDGGSALIPSTGLAALRSAPCVAAVTPDGKLKPSSIGAYDPTQDTGSLYNTTRLIGAQQTWNKGYTGKGVGVALIDTGVAPVQGLNASGKVFNGPDLSFDSQTSDLTYNDEYGHGTHMAGIIAGNDLYGAAQPGSYAGNTSAFIGVAPDARILNMKVGDENGVVDVSQVIASIDWVVQHRNDNGLNIRVLNLSYGTNSGQAYALDPLAYAAEVAWKNNIVVVAAVGNGGSGSSGLNDPAYDPYLLAVGAADTQSSNDTSDDTVATFSNSGDGTRNPDLVAPGTHIEGLRDPGSEIDQLYGSSATVGTRFFLGSGTSQAAAVVSGAAALYLSAKPTATADMVKRALTKSATWLANQPATRQGSGEVNVAGALKQESSAQQNFTGSRGTGTLDAARGGMDVVSNGTALTGEQDIFGNAWNSTSMAQAESTGAAWSGGTFNGAAWSGAAWSGSSWMGAAWSGAAWSGAAWSGAAWSGATWNGAAWSGAAWSGAAWSGAAWSGAAWSGAAWSGAAWSGAAWSGAEWSGAGWSDYSWS